MPSWTSTGCRTCAQRDGALRHPDRLVRALLEQGVVPGPDLLEQGRALQQVDQRPGERGIEVRQRAEVDEHQVTRDAAASARAPARPPTPRRSARGSPPALRRRAPRRRSVDLEHRRLLAALLGGRGAERLDRADERLRAVHRVEERHQLLQPRRHLRAAPAATARAGARPGASRRRPRRCPLAPRSAISAAIASSRAAHVGLGQLPAEELVRRHAAAEEQLLRHLELDERVGGEPEARVPSPPARRARFTPSGENRQSIRKPKASATNVSPCLSGARAKNDVGSRRSASPAPTGGRPPTTGGRGEITGWGTAGG